MSVLDRAANWAHAEPRRKRRVPPQGIPQLSVEKILSFPPDIFDDAMFDTGLEDNALPNGSFVEIRRLVSVESTLFSFFHHSS